MDISGDCFQDILHNCTNNHLTGYSWWVDRNGRNNTYWHGDGFFEQGCACSMEPGLNCSDNHGSDHLCNCDDSNDNDIDLGTLRGFEQLPVIGLFTAILNPDIHGYSMISVVYTAAAKKRHFRRNQFS